MPATVDIIGVHPIEAPEPCHLIELRVVDSSGPFDLREITQPIRDRTSEEWQVPWDEKILDPSGVQVVLDAWDVRDQPSVHWNGDVRLAFFFHYLDLERPLETPFGEYQLPPETPRPARLEFMQYESPC